MTTPTPLLHHTPSLLRGLNAGSGTLSTDPMLDRADHFLAVLGREGVHTSEQTAEARARGAAEQLVSVALVQPMLAQLRDTNAAAPPFAPTPGERQFRALADASLAGQIVRAAQFPLVDQLARRMLERLHGTEGVVSTPSLHGRQRPDA